MDSVCASKFSKCPLDWCGPMLLCDGEIRRIPSGIGGVYLIHVFIAERGRYGVLYAGKSGDLASRLAQHLRGVATPPEIVVLRARQALSFSAAPVLDPALRGHVEAGLIVRFRPPANRQVPTAAPLFTSLPPLGAL